MYSTVHLCLAIRAITMDKVISFLVLSTLLQHAVSRVVPETTFRAVLENLSKESRIFSGQSVKLKCSVPDIHKSTWNFLWYKEAEKLPFTGETLSLWNIGVKEDGIYTCKGVRDTAVGNIYTLESLPVQINVDGGWAILRAPHDPALVGDTLKVTCQLRQNFPVTGAILYRDGFEVMSQSSLEFELTDLSLDDNGMYSCRVSWEANGRTLSVISVETEVVVKEVLTKPVMEVVPKDGSQFVTLICRAEYNGKAPILFYFYKNKVQLGTANSGGTDTYRKSPGLYSCKAKVPQLGLTLWSEPTPYEPAADL
ncbi:hypothetical protein INR49_022131 [Caranx melampygus]|nr:hypothetical protein INR49_022131 [Caranx melampygus]